LDSEKELAYFEKRETGSNHLFRGNRLKEYFPKYAGIEFFFTGLFTEKFLWKEVTIDKKDIKYDYEIKEL
ncbi:MAG: hypothetical protein ACXACP_13515, partial [Candidatus Hodarchaeales archaeon]